MTASAPIYYVMRKSPFLEYLSYNIVGGGVLDAPVILQKSHCCKAIFGGPSRTPAPTKDNLKHLDKSEFDGFSFVEMPIGEGNCPFVGKNIAGLKELQPLR